MNFDFINIAFNKLFDKTESLAKRFFLFIVMIFLILFLDNKFNFSNNYVIENKINNIGVIESIKKDIIPNYQANVETNNQINNLENQIFEESSWIQEAFLYIKKLMNGSIKIDILMFISIQWLWILFLGIIFYQTIQKGKGALGELIGLLFFITLIMLLWGFLFPILQALLGIENRAYAIIFNIFFNILILSILGILGRKKK